MFFKKSVAERRALILNGDIMKTLLILSIPTILMALIQSFISLSDGIFLNNFGGYLIAGSVTFCQPVLNILVGLGQGLGVAGMAIIGQINGRGDIEEVKRVSLQLIVFSFLLAIVIAPMTILAALILSSKVNPEISGYVFQYLSLYAAILPLQFMASIYNAVKNAIGQPEATFIRVLLLLILKIIFNFIFLYWFQFGIIGAVLASFLSYIIICIWMYYDLFVKNTEIKLSFKNFSFDKSILKKVLHIGFPSMISYMLVSLGFFLINLEVESYGPKVLNALGIASSINALSFMLPSSISTTITTMVSMNIGTKNVKKSKKIARKGYILSLAISLLIIAIIIPTTPALVRLFQHEDQEIINIAVNSLYIYTFAIIGFSVYMVSNGVLIGLGRTKITMVTGILRIWFFRYIFILAFRDAMQYDAVIWGNFFSNMISALLMVLILKKINWHSDII